MFHDISGKDRGSDGISTWQGTFNADSRIGRFRSRLWSYIFQTIKDGINLIVG